MLMQLSTGQAAAPSERLAGETPTPLALLASPVPLALLASPVSLATCPTEMSEWEYTLAMDNLFTNPPGQPLVAPSILSADFAHLADQCRQVLDAGADLLHVDVMDGHFVPNLTFGPALVKSLARALPEAFLDVHLMVTDPGMFVEPFIEAGAGHVSFHVEPIGLAACVELAQRVRSLGATAGIVINPPTPAEDILPELGAFDLVLVMSVNPGFGGQAFLSEVLEKVRIIASGLRPDQRLEMDGGIGTTTAHAAREAGCDVLVAGSAIFHQLTGQWPTIFEQIRGNQSE